MTADFSLPAVTQTEADYAQAIRNLFIALALGLDTAASNTPTGAIRWSAANSRFEKFNGSTWAVLTAKMLMDVDTLDGLHAAAFALVGHNHAATYQALHANLTALAGLSLVADRMAYANGTSTLALATLTAAGRALLDDASAAAQRTTLGLTALASLALTANKVLYIDSAGVPRLLALGAAGTVLTSAGATAAPTFTAGASGSPTSYITGLAPAWSTTTTLSVAAGKARDDADAADIALASAMTKSLSAWAAGTGNGGLDTGTIAASTYYYIWLIKRTDGTAVDVLLSLSGTAPTMPANYTIKRCIGRIRTNASSQINQLIMISANPSVGGCEIWTTAETGGAYIQPPWTPEYVSEVQAGGGGGVAARADNAITSGGASGGYALKRMRAQPAGTSVTMTIGTGGGVGAAGGTSSFGAIMSCTGGGAGKTQTISNTPGTATGGDINIGGSYGSMGAGTTTSAVGADGADSVLGLGGIGYYSTVAAAPATGYGAGGGSNSCMTSGTGGVGGPGLIRLTF